MYNSECLRLAELHHGQTSREAGSAHYFLAESYERHRQHAMARKHFESAWGVYQITKRSLATERLILDGLVRICGALGEKKDMEKYQTLRHASAGKKICTHQVADAAAWTVFSEISLSAKSTGFPAPPPLPSSKMS